MNRTIAGWAGAVVALALGGGGGYWFAIHRMHAAAPASVAEGVEKLIDGVVQDNSGKRVLYWHDPMVPQQRFQKPGKSPFMDMQLAPVYASGVDAGGVEISSRVGQNLGVRTAAVATGTLERKLEVIGTVGYNERAVVLVQTRAAGFVERLYAKVPLEPVRKGEPLVELLVPDWAGAQAEYLAIRRMPGADLESLKRAARQRLLLLGMSEAQIEGIDQSGQPEGRLTIHAPTSGIVAELGVREGMNVPAGATLYRIVDLGAVWVTAEVPEAESAALRLGAKVEARVPAWPGDVFRGQVSAILPDVNLATRTLKARIELANPGARLKPGMFANLTIATRPGRSSLLVPSEAVIRTGERSVVIVQEAPGRFRSVEVRTGFESGDQIEITSGLKSGDTVVVSGQFLIDSEASLKGAGLRMSEPAAVIHRGLGRIERIAPDAITLSHQPIPSLKWGEMTMEFKPPAAGMPANIKSGDAVEFEFRAGKDGDYELTSVRFGVKR